MVRHNRRRNQHSLFRPCTHEKLSPLDRRRKSHQSPTLAFRCTRCCTCSQVVKAPGRAAEAAGLEVQMAPVREAVRADLQVSEATAKAGKVPETMAETMATGG